MLQVCCRLGVPGGHNTCEFISCLVRNKCRLSTRLTPVTLMLRITQTLPAYSGTLYRLYYFVVFIFKLSFFFVELTNSFVLFSGTYYILIHELQGLIGLYVKGKYFVTVPKLQNIKTKNYQPIIYNTLYLNSCKGPVACLKISSQSILLVNGILILQSTRWACGYTSGESWIDRATLTQSASAAVHSLRNFSNIVGGHAVMAEHYANRARSHYYWGIIITSRLTGACGAKIMQGCNFSHLFVTLDLLALAPLWKQMTIGET